MKTQHPQQQKITDHAASFAGFGEWFEIFRAGTHEDMKGRKLTVTNADLDSMIANHSAQAPFPFVLGHPAHNDPAYGWSTDLKRDGSRLFAKGRATVQEFEDAVKSELFPNRSVSVVPDGNGGYKIRHLGWLGAKMPAVEGMPRLNFSAEDADNVYSFSVSATPRALHTIKRVLRNLREYLIGTASQEAADRVVSDWEIESIDEAADALEGVRRDAANMFSQGNEELAMQQNNRQAEVDAAHQRAQGLQDENKTLKEKLQAQEFAAAKSAAQVVIDKAITDGVLLPAQAVGWVDFIASLTDETEFSFAAADGKPVKESPRHFALNFIGKLGPQIKVGSRSDEPPEGGGVSSFIAPAGFTVDQERAALDVKARDYMAKNNVDYVVAYKAVGGT